ncbi:DNA-binding transcriptional regulator [Sphingomonas sp. SORGH_AS_0879]|uniref:helix-turn-helix domain-containing protein n=1 Tax=Sphingomonas sp. SORGH_AS_0879 TaxID=3041790 RepID=UPI0027D812AA|nr:helix-turn-helix transcriptional regulator [Sphingomonas sp. SORGH_AS_0879]
MLGGAVVDWSVVVREVRRMHRLKQEAFAQLIQVSQTTISRWEMGRQIPELRFQNWFIENLRKLDPVSPDDMIVSLIRRSATPRCMVNSDFRYVLVSDGERRLLGADVEKVINGYIGDIIAQQAGHLIDEYFAQMLRPGCEITGLSYDDEGYIAKGRKFRRTWNVVTVDGVRFLAGEDIELDEPLDNEKDLNLRIFNDAGLARNMLGCR